MNHAAISRSSTRTYLQWSTNIGDTLPSITSHLARSERASYTIQLDNFYFRKQKLHETISQTIFKVQQQQRYALDATFAPLRGSHELTRPGAHSSDGHNRSSGSTFVCLWVCDIVEFFTQSLYKLHMQSSQTNNDNKLKTQLDIKKITIRCVKQ